MRERFYEGVFHIESPFANWRIVSSPPDARLTVVGDVQAGDVVDLGDAALQHLGAPRPQLETQTSTRVSRLLEAEPKHQKKATQSSTWHQRKA